MISTIELENTYSSGVYSKRPVAIVRGCGALLWDAEGREFIDCAAGHGVANVGHARPEVAAAIAAQAQRLITCPEIFYNDVRARLLERLAHLVPEGLTRIFLCNSGTEAVEGALKFARIATGRTGIVAALRSFHGRTMGALAITWEPHYREPFEPLVPGVSHVRYNDLVAAEVAINEQTAAVIIELVQGEGGVHVAADEYVQGLTSLCRERGAMLIVDEVQTGFGRTGRLFACVIGEPSGSQAVTIGYKGRLLVEYGVSRPAHHSAGAEQHCSEVAVAFWNHVWAHANAWNERHAASSTFAALMPSLRSMQSSQDGLEEHAQLLVGYRLPPGYDGAGLRAQLEQWASQDGARVSFSGEEAAFQSTRATPLARAFLAAIRATGGQPVFKHKTGTSDMNVVGPAWGQNIVAYGPGDSHLDHTPGEHIRIAEYLHAIDVLERVLGAYISQGEMTQGEMTQ